MSAPSLTAHSSGSESDIITSSDPTGTRRGRYGTFPHSQIEMLRSRELKQTGPGPQASWLSFVQGSVFSHSQSTGWRAATVEGRGLPLSLPRLLNDCLLDSSISQTASNQEALRACRHSFSGNATALQSVEWDSTSSGITKVQISLRTLTPLLFGVSSSHKLRRYHLLWLQKTLRPDEGEFSLGLLLLQHLYLWGALPATLLCFWLPITSPFHSKATQLSDTFLRIL